jgi:uncharacterized protein
VKVHPFSPERQIGVICGIEGSFADVAFTAAGKLPKAHFGQYLGRGEVGEFVLVDVGGTGAFGRLLRVESATTNVEMLSQQESKIQAQGRVQLLSTLHLDGAATRGILRYPKIGDPVYAAGGEAIESVLRTGASDDELTLTLGRLSVDDSVPIAVPLTRLFGRHLAVVGATGSGKSWTLAALAEGVSSLGGKMILIDATGEFHTLGAHAQHLAFGALDDEPDDTKLVGIPHYMMRESDRNAFLNPSGGVQLPKLREAVRTLRLAIAIRSDPQPLPQHQAIPAADGSIIKSGGNVATYQAALSRYAAAVEGAQAPFDLKLLAIQVQNECIWMPRTGETAFGGPNNNDLGYVSSLVSRISDLLQLPEVMGVIDPQPGVGNALEEIAKWIQDPNSHVLRISLRNLTFTNHLREIVVNILGQTLLGWSRAGSFRTSPLVVAIDEAHQFFDVTVGDEFASTRLNAFDSIAKEGRKYGLTVCMATQRPGDLPAGVLSQVGMTIVHRLADGRDRQRIEQAAAELDHSATRLLPGLVPGEAILMGVDFPIPVSVRMQAPVAPPSSDGPKYQNWGAGRMAD